MSKGEEVVKHFSSLLIVLTGTIGIPIRPIDFLALSALIFKFLIDPSSKSPARFAHTAPLFAGAEAEKRIEEKGKREEVGVR